jgi:hypothetical protein
VSGEKIGGSVIAVNSACSVDTLETGRKCIFLIDSRHLKVRGEIVEHFGMGRPEPQVPVVFGGGGPG